MKVRVLYFARLREAVGRSSEDIVLGTDVATIGDLRRVLTERGERWREAFAGDRRIRAALNQDMVADDAPLEDGAEVAFFPPVTGG